jgi:hypothetical protein
MIQPGWALLSGLTGGLAFLVVIWDAIMGGIFGASFLQVLGGSLVHRASRGLTYAVGLTAHFVLAGAFGLVYGWLIGWIDPSSFAEGAAGGLLVGLAHGAVATAVLAWALPHIHGLAPPGGSAAGTAMLGGHQRSTAAIWIVAHAVYGLTVGAAYTVATL